MESRRLSRREFLKAAGLSGLGLALAACAPGGGAAPAAAPAAEEAAAPKPAAQGPTPILFWFQAENHKPEYEARIQELNEKFNIDFKFEILSRDAMTQKFPATLMAGSGFPDIIEQNAGDVVKFMKGDDKVIPFLALNEVLKASPYYEQVLKSRWDRFTKDGLIYAAPHDVHPLVMLYNDAAWKQFGVDLSQVVTWDDLLAACEQVELTMPDGRPRFPIMDCLSCTHLPARMLEKGIWWTDENGEPMLTDPRFRECVEDFMRFKPYWSDIDWANQVAMMKEGQVMSQLAPDWLYGIHKQGTADDKEFLANSPMRVMRIPDFVPDGPHSGTWGGTGCSVPKQSPVRDLAVEVMLYLYFDNSKGQLEERYVATGILPPVVTAWEGEAFHQPEDYVGGQVAGEVFIAAAKDLPSYYENWKTNLVADAWSEQFSLLWEGQISIDEAIATADKNARENIEKNA